LFLPGGTGRILKGKIMRYSWLIFEILLVTFWVLTGCKTRNEKIERSSREVQERVTSDNQDSDITIHQAALEGQINLVRKMLAEGFDENKIDEDGRTPLMYAAFNGCDEIIKLLIDKGALINACDTNGRTALMMASSGPYPATVKTLLDHQADPDLTDKEEHFTALMYAAAEGQLDVVRILLAYNADPALKDVDGDDALTFAKNNGHTAIATLLASFKK
jgi:ankyrin repeat protein